VVVVSRDVLLEEEDLRRDAVQAQTLRGVSTRFKDVQKGVDRSRGKRSDNFAKKPPAPSEVVPDESFLDDLLNS